MNNLSVIEAWVNDEIDLCVIPRKNGDVTVLYVAGGVPGIRYFSNQHEANGFIEEAGFGKPGYSTNATESPSECEGKED